MWLPPWRFGDNLRLVFLALLLVLILLMKLLL
jgi:hypothetical protein